MVVVTWSQGKPSRGSVISLLAPNATKFSSSFPHQNKGTNIRIQQQPPHRRHSPQSPLIVPARLPVLVHQNFAFFLILPSLPPSLPPSSGQRQARAWRPRHTWPSPSTLPPPPSPPTPTSLLPLPRLRLLRLSFLIGPRPPRRRKQPGIGNLAESGRASTR